MKKTSAQVNASERIEDKFNKILTQDKDEQPGVKFDVLFAPFAVSLAAQGWQTFRQVGCAPRFAS